MLWKNYPGAVNAIPYPYYPVKRLEPPSIVITVRSAQYVVVLRVDLSFSVFQTFEYMAFGPCMEKFMVTIIVDEISIAI